MLLLTQAFIIFTRLMLSRALFWTGSTAGKTVTIDGKATILAGLYYNIRQIKMFSFPNQSGNKDKTFISKPPPLYMPLKQVKLKMWYLCTQKLLTNLITAPII